MKKELKGCIRKIKDFEIELMKILYGMRKVHYEAYFSKQDRYNEQFQKRQILSITNTAWPVQKREAQPDFGSQSLLRENIYNLIYFLLKRNQSGLKLIDAASKA
ncbi:unnamed protein product [Paramecium sonneborni]|uniref:Uncharacterized protein n=1 Tax=Paramecium sonneborni TaxID=65129 RepID=A0A8S1RTN3_9CILI|nr:unnamed protein product [Paramecium sonneborni]